MKEITIWEKALVGKGDDNNFKIKKRRTQKKKKDFTVNYFIFPKYVDIANISRYANDCVRKR